MNAPPRFVWLIRHAKTEGHFTKPDFERQLTSRGYADCRTMRDLLSDHAEAPSLFVASGAVRALETAKQLASGSAASVETDSSFYYADVSDYVARIRAQSEEIRSVGFVGHNPTVSECIEWLCSSSERHVLPTLGMAQLQVNDNWHEIRRESCVLVSLFRPKELRR